jgi:hypothetical protein
LYNSSYLLILVIILQSILDRLTQFDQFVGHPEEGVSASGRSRGRRQARYPRAPPAVMGGGRPADQFLHHLISNLVGGGGFGMMPGSIQISTSGASGGRDGFPPPGSGFIQLGSAGGGSVPMMPLYGNPGDYAWGRGGLDAIVTQLLNQMDGTGPPPMSEDEIKKIPTIKVDQSHIGIYYSDFKCFEKNSVSQQCKAEYFRLKSTNSWLALL